MKEKQPACPPALVGEAIKEWKRITAEIGPEISPADRAILTVYCEQYRQWADAVAHVAEQGSVVKMPNGWPQPNPYLAIVTKTTTQIGRLLSQLGATPAARVRDKGKQTDATEPQELEF